MADILYKEESYKIIGTCMKVHSELGAGFLESVYQEALEKQFIKDGIPYEREKLLKIDFDGQQLKKSFKADYVCYNKIIVELKAAIFIHNDNIEQTRNYLKATKLQLGLIVNFGETSLKYKRVLNSYNSH
ncbi:MAG TPA: GxxExxY protein [Paludibacteraceae bacterium]|nr:GxxExxY protein [Paludibacteraceae bacterium]